MTGPTALPWAALQYLAARKLRWTPATFWAATPRELAAALGLASTARPLARAELAALSAAWPDDLDHGKDLT